MRSDRCAGFTDRVTDGEEKFAVAHAVDMCGCRTMSLPCQLLVSLELGGFLEGSGVFLGVGGFLGGTASSWVFLEDM